MFRGRGQGENCQWVSPGMRIARCLRRGTCAYREPHLCVPSACSAAPQHARCRMAPGRHFKRKRRKNMLKALRGVSQISPSDNRCPRIDNRGHRFSPFWWPEPSQLHGPSLLGVINERLNLIFSQAFHKSPRRVQSPDELLAARQVMPLEGKQHTEYSVRLNENPVRLLNLFGVLRAVDCASLAVVPE